MQTLWSRAAQTRWSCHCSGSSLSTGLSRRTATAAGRRRPKVGDTFTAFYSAIFATAAVADAKLKEDRREEWDRVIGAAKRDLEATATNPAGRTPSDIRIQLDDSRDGTSSTHIGWDKALRDATTGALPIRDRPEASFARICRLQESRWAAHDGPYGHSFDTNKPNSYWQIETQERSIANLVGRLMKEVSSGRQRQHTGDCATHEIARSDAITSTSSDMALMLRHMQDRLTSMTMLPEHGGSPDYPAYSSGAEPSTAELNDLNEAIYRQFKHHRENGLDFELMIAKICYNLLVSTTPPNADTYNILINHLRRLKENTLVRCVLDSYFESRVTPNEVTISSILKFYTVSRDASGFHRFLRLMKGYDGGLGRAKRRTNLETCNSRALEDWRNYRCDGGMVIKKAPRNKEVYGALIHGALIFSGMHTAMDFLWEMIEDGLQANLKLLTSMLQACARTQDWESGQAIWEEMRGLHPEHDSLDGRAYFWMLRLCRACGKEDAFQTIYKQAAKRFVERPPAPTRRSQYLVDIQNGDRRLALGDWKLPPLPAEPVHAPVQESALGPRSIPSDAQPEGNIVSTDFGDSSFLKQYDLRAATMMPEDRIEVSTFAGVG